MQVDVGVERVHLEFEIIASITIRVDEHLHHLLRPHPIVLVGVDRPDIGVTAGEGEVQRLVIPEHPGARHLRDIAELLPHGDAVERVDLRRRRPDELVEFSNGCD